VLFSPLNSATNIKQHDINQRIIRNRLLVSVIFIVFFCVLLIARQFYLQVIKHQIYASIAEKNRIALRAVAPQRGLIFDRNGEVLAFNRPSFNLTLVREATPNWRNVIHDVIELLNLDPNLQQELEQKILAKKRFDAVPILFELSSAQIAKIAVNQYRLPGVAINADLIRDYPYKDLFAHAIGYVGRINEEELKQLDKNYAATNYIGKTAVEKIYQEQLHGLVGFEEVEVDSRGRTIRVLRRDEPQAGQNITLSLDIKLQQQVVKALDAKRAAAVVMDVKTGEVLALVSTPSFDPNLFVTGISNDIYQQLRNSAQKPLFNRALRGLYPPGSTIKPMMAVAGLDSKVITTQSSVFDRGFYKLQGSSHQYRNWNRGGDGAVNLRLALARSNDTYFYDLAHKLGIDRLHLYLTKFGLGSKVSLDMTEELAGLVPSKEWKRDKLNQVWYPGETLIAGIGQGYMLTTPLQLAHSTALLANKGKWIAPHIAKKIGTQEINPRNKHKDIILSSDNIWHEVQKGMYEVVHGARGTAKRAGLKSIYNIAGKTGTAQVIAIKQGEIYKRNKVPEYLRDHALFIAFAPLEKPQIAVAVIVENGESGSGTAAPIARKIMDAWLLTQDGKLKS